MLEFSRALVVVAFDEVDCFAVDPLAIGRDLFDSPQAEISKEIEHVIRLHTFVQTVCDHLVHFLSSRKGTIAVPNDIEVTEVKVGCEPNIAHSLFSCSLVPMLHTLLLPEA